MTAERRADTQRQLLEQRGAQVLSAPVLRTVDLGRDPALLAVTRALLAQPPDVLVLLTGQGATWWFEAADAAGHGAALRGALTSTQVVTRGSKATSTARRLGLEVAWQAPDEVVDQVVEHVAAMGAGVRVAVQLDGADDDHVLAALRRSGAEATGVPVYRWTLPVDPAPALDLVGRIVAGTVDAVTFTASPAVVNLARLADSVGRVTALDAAMAGTVRAVCVGPVCSATARARGWSRIIEPERSRLVAMVDALVDQWHPRDQPR